MTNASINLSTMEEETIEGDYTDNGRIDHLELSNKGNFEIYLESLSEKANPYKEKVRAKEISEFYLS